MLSTASYPAASYRIQNSYNLIPPPVYFGFHRPVILVTIFWGHLSLSPYFWFPTWWLPTHIWSSHLFWVAINFLQGHRSFLGHLSFEYQPSFGYFWLEIVFLVGSSLGWKYRSSLGSPLINHILRTSHIFLLFIVMYFYISIWCINAFLITSWLNVKGNVVNTTLWLQWRWTHLTQYKYTKYKIV